MVETSFDFLKYIISYDATKLKSMVKCMVPTWSIFIDPVTNSKSYDNSHTSTAMAVTYEDRQPI